VGCDPLNYTLAFALQLKKITEKLGRRTKGKTFKAYIPQIKAHWIKGQKRCLFIFHLFPTDAIFIEVLTQA
jgi:hypothetical protein